MQNRPAYHIASVDHCLLAIMALRDDGPLRLADLAERLGVARSTAHRIMAMLVFRDFAEQDDQRRYALGPALRDGVAPSESAVLRARAWPHLRDLARRTTETANLVVRAGHSVRFLATVEASQVLRVGDREGRLLPVHRASGGLALLAAMSADELHRTLAGMPDPAVDPAALQRVLRRVRRQGFALNDQGTERGVTAIGRPVRGPDGAAVAAISVAMPSTRFRRTSLPHLAAELAATTEAVESDLRAAATR